MNLLISACIAIVWGAALIAHRRLTNDRHEITRQGRVSVLGKTLSAPWSQPAA
jgi:hypothetical protein